MEGGRRADKLPNTGEASFTLAAHGYRYGMRHMPGARQTGAAIAGAICSPVLSATCARIGVDATQDLLDPHTEKPTYYGAHVFNGLGRAAGGDLTGLGEAGVYGVEGGRKRPSGCETRFSSRVPAGVAGAVRVPVAVGEGYVTGAGTVARNEAGSAEG